ncbi:MAG: PAS domain S-box protein [Sneathiella sp.]|nr:PAS domain S-box protein [Sneathiella sp.]
MKRNLTTDLEHQLFDALESLTEAFVLYDADHRLILCNTRLLEIYGLSADEALPGTHLRDVALANIRKGHFVKEQTPETVDLYIAERLRRIDCGQGTYDIQLKDGRIIHVNEKRTASGGIVSIQRDLTARRKLEEENRRSRVLFEAAFNANSSICSITVLDTGKFLDVNNAWCECLGYTREEAVGKTAVELQIWGNAYNRAKVIDQLKTGKNLVGFRSQVRTKEGDIRKIILNSEIMEVDGLDCLFISGQDITEINEAEIALSESQERLAGFARASTDWYWEQDCNQRFTYLSNNVSKSLGKPTSYFLGRTMEQVYGQYEDPGMAEINRQFEAREPFREVILKRTHPITFETVWLRTSGQPYYDSDGEFQGYRGATTDITEKVFLEEHLQQSQKMEAIGQLTGGVAHDFNNLLAIIQGNGEFLLEAAECADPKLQRHVSAIMRAADRGAELTQSMLAFSRKQDLRPSQFYLNERIGSILGLLQRTLGETIEIEPTFADGLWPCLADAGKFENAFLNLCINSRDAMPNGGTLTIGLTNCDARKQPPEGDPELSPGEYIRMTVRDTGAGIPEEVLPHIMEPFFTTKEVGKGTGLGLSMVYGFAHQSQGHLSIHSREGEGTEVRLYLPKAAD